LLVFKAEYTKLEIRPSSELGGILIFLSLTLASNP